MQSSIGIVPLDAEGAPPAPAAAATAYDDDDEDAPLSLQQSPVAASAPVGKARKKTVKTNRKTAFK